VAVDIGKALTKMSLWFKNSGLKVNEEKTEVVIFFKNNCHPEDVMITEKIIRTKNTMKVLGVLMDSTLTWNDHINKTVNSIQSKIHAIRVIQRYFEKDELLILLKTYCYPSLYYASNVWLTPGLTANLKSKLFSASGKILSIIKIDSFKNLHKQFTRNVAKLRTSNLTLRSQHH